MIENDVDNSSTTTEELNIGSADLVSTGEDHLRPGGTSTANNNTSSNSYGSYQSNDVNTRAVWDWIAPGNVQGRVAIALNVDPGTDQIDVRLQNITDSETAAEVTGITSSGETTIGPLNYTPTTTSTPVQFQVEYRNSDNSTTVTIYGATVYLGVGL